MPEFRHHSLADINLIADNLRDRYANGFPVLKELVQNADDAGATSLDFALLDGLASAANPLLNGPALACVNDGPFSDEDALAITYLGLSGKAARQDTVGKFGLGQKSVFHLCETFFYLASDALGTDPPGRPARASVLNPWAQNGQDSCFPAWEQFAPDDRQAIATALGEALPKKNWFLLWLPLRRPEHRRHGTGVILPNEPTPDAVHREMLEDPWRVSRLLPLLATVRRIRYWRVQEAGTALAPVWSVQASSGGTRLPRHGRGAASDRTELAGVIEVRIQNKRRPALAHFAGIEALVADPRADMLRECGLWPRSFVRDPETLEEKPADDKAAPQGAALLLRSPAGPTGGKLSVEWAVFLPVADQSTEIINCPGDHDYTLLLHGYFFLDAGRARIEALDEPAPDSFEPRDHEQVRRCWNALIRDRATLARIPATLLRFARRVEAPVEEMERVCRHLRSSALFASHAAAICSEQALVQSLTPDKSSWTLIDSSASVLPMPRVATHDWPWSVFPDLGRIALDRTITWHDSPNLRLPGACDSWTPELLAELLPEDPDALFGARPIARNPFFRYFCDTIALSEPVVRRSRELQMHLLQLMRRVVSRREIDALTGNTVQFQQLVGCLPRGRVLGLPEQTPPVVYRELCSTAAAFLPLPRSLAPQEPDGCALDLASLEAMLDPLDSIVRSGSADAEGASRAAESIVLAARLGLNALKEGAISELQVFRCRDIRADKRVPVSVRELLQAWDQGILFIDSPLLPMVRALQAALPGHRVLTIHKETATAVFGADTISACNPAGCLQAVLQADVLGSLETRVELARFLRGADTTGHKRALRYLLHADPSRRDDEAELVYVQDETWEPIARRLFHAQSASWRFVEPALAGGFLTTDACAALGVTQFKGRDVLAAIVNADDRTWSRLELTREQRERILAEVRDSADWAALPFHETLEGKILSIGQNCFLADLEAVPPSLRGSLHLIRPADDPDAARVQRDRLPPWNADAQIATALAQPSPSDFWVEILSVVHAANPEIRHRLRTSSWLPVTGGGAAAPAVVLHPPAPLEAALAEPALASRLRLSTTSHLEGQFRRHPAWLEHGLPLCVKGDDCLVPVAEAARRSEGLRIAPLPHFPVQDALTALSGVAVEGVPGWKLLEAAWASGTHAQVERTLLPALQGDLSDEALIGMISALERAHSSSNGLVRDAASRVARYYFSWICGRKDVVAILGKLRLPNRLGIWKPADCLSASAPNVEDSDLLHEDFRDLLPDELLWPGPGTAQPESAGNSQKTKAVRETLRPGDGQSAVFYVLDPPAKLDPKAESGAAGVLESYFKPWLTRVSQVAIGAFLALLGDHKDMRRLASRHLQSHSIDWVRSGLRSAGRGSSIDVPYLAGRSRFAFITDVAGRLRVRSLTGRPFDAALRREADSIFIGDLPRFEECTDALGRIEKSVPTLAFLRLRRIERLEDKDLLKLLRRSIDQLLTQFYGVSRAGLAAFDAVWSDATARTQFDIEVAREAMIEHLPAHLHHIGVRGCSSLTRVLQVHDNVCARRIEARKSATGPGKVDDEYEKARDALVRQVEENPEAQQAILCGVRRKLSAAAYRVDRVPFEIFQNADDSVVELIQMQGSSDGLDGATEFTVLSEKDALSFVHRGRCVNQFAVTDRFDGEARGFKLDLQKMLSIGHSDKFDDEHTTGKFGLGFKAIHLVTSSPSVFSGRLQFRVVAGILPVETSELDDRIEPYTGLDLPPTMIHLPLDAGHDADEVLASFERLAALLPIFARAIRSIAMFGPGPGAPRTFAWRPIRLEGLEELGLAPLSAALVESASALHGLLFQAGPASLLAVAGPRGLMPLAADVPTFWCTAPTAVRWQPGYCVNGPLDVDIGRTELASDSRSNRDLIDELGAKLGLTLTRLFDRATRDWESCSRELRLDAGLEPYEFWESVWRLFTRCIGDPLTDLLARLQGRGNGISRLVSDRDALPSGLTGDHRILTRVSAVRRCVTGSLARVDVLSRACRLPGLERELGAGTVVSRDVAQRLMDIGFSRIPELNLATAVELALGPRLQVDARTAGLLGEFIAPGAVLDPGERERLEGLLGAALFPSADGTFTRASKLLVAGPCKHFDPDEALRAAMATGDRLLSEDFQGAAVDFFAFARPRMEAPVADMASWARAARSTRTRDAVLRYLAEGELGSNLARELAQQRPSWLPASRQELLERLSDSGWNDDEAWQLAVALYPPAPHELRGAGTVPIRAPRRKEPGKVLAAIQEWWRSERDEAIARYEKHWFPGRNALHGLTDERSKSHRSDWMTLLVLGSLHRMGGRRPWQHRGFLDFCKRHGWWQVFAQTRPLGEPQKWIEVLHAFADEHSQNQEYEHWMREFPTMFRFAHWLEDYVRLFRSLPERKKPTHLVNVLSPKTDRHWSGTGLLGDTPPIDRSLGLGACFVVRELARRKVLSGPLVWPHCYVPTQGLKDVMDALGCDLKDPMEHTNPINSEGFHEFLVLHLGETGARFGGDLDLPFVTLISEKYGSQWELFFEREQPADDDATMESVGALEEEE